MNTFDPAEVAITRGHTERLYLSSADSELDLFAPSGADLDGSFDATCALTGERLSVRGWLYALVED